VLFIEGLAFEPSHPFSAVNDSARHEGASVPIAGESPCAETAPVSSRSR
jgi:hypothetical protein